MNTLQQSLRQWAGQEVVSDPRARSALGVFAFVVLTALGALVAVPLPFTAVPITLQTLFVILAGALLGARAGAVAMAAYVLLGAAGAPVYAYGNGGIVWLLGPSGGYLLSYPAAAFVVGWIVGNGKDGARLALALAAGTLVIYMGGLSQLWMLTRQEPGTLLVMGMLPFLPGDLFKLFVAWMTVRSFRATRFGR